MDVDCDDNASDKSVQFEDMEIESFGATEEETPDERRAKMDKKIEDKKKQMEQDEIVKENLKREIESKKKAVRQQKLEKTRKDIKLKKQKSKDTRKRINKRKKSGILEELDLGYNVPNLKEVPAGCLHLVNKEDVIYEVPGDGACCPNCAAAFFFQDEVFGPKLRMSMYSFFVKH